MEKDYNTTRKKLVLPEYGRNIQKMVDHLITIEDRNERNIAAKTIINVMGNMNPHLRDVSDFKHKLWDHLAIMADFKLDIDFPFELPQKEVLMEKPRRVPYSNYKIRYKHYGKALELLIDKASEIEEKEEKDALIKLIANHMKKSFLTWNREVVSDEQIISDLNELSGGKLNVPIDMKLTETKDILAKNRRKRSVRKK
jgi:hypothetical protein